jgi:hypothetical protein
MESARGGCGVMHQYGIIITITIIIVIISIIINIIVIIIIISIIINIIDINIDVFGTCCEGSWPMMLASGADRWWWLALLASGDHSAGQWCWPTITIIVIIIIIVTIIISNIIIIAIIIDVFGTCCQGSLANDARQWC